ncbi:MAG: glycine cleavage system protein GcvH [Thermoplasmata archaeon]|nr:glycine cleavage system protein GcvH [Thermoplasmata archaeon]
MKIDEYDMPDDLYYHEEHIWAKKEGDIIVIGVNDFAQKMAGTIKRVVTLEEEDEVQQGKPMGTLSSGKWTGKLYAPVSGEITEINEDLEDNPALVNNSPYDEGWVAKIEPSDPDEINNLIKGGTDKLAEWLKGQIQEHKK